MAIFRALLWTLWRARLYLALLVAFAAWRPSQARFALRLLGRSLEVAWIYAPLLPWLIVCWAIDRITTSAPGHTWVDTWWDLVLRKAQRSGPVVVKMGQWAATRPDLLPEEWCSMLKRLHDSTEAHDLVYTHRSMEAAFPAEGGRPWFRRLLLEPRPVGSGCIAQVYIGYLVGGEQAPHDPLASKGQGCGAGLSAMCRRCLPWRGLAADSGLSTGGRHRCTKVAVKVVHPQVRRAVEIDLRVLHMVAAVCDSLGLDGLGVSLMLRQFADFLESQTDLRHEACNLRSFREKVGGGGADGLVVVPEVYDDWVARDILVMSFEEGEPLSELLGGSSAAAMGSEKKEIWRVIVDLFWAMVFKHRIVHGDMHPGNVFWRRANAARGVQIVLLDCGLVIDLSGQAGEDLSMMVKAFLTKKEEEVAALLITLSERVGGRPEDVVDPDGFISGIAQLIREGMGVGFKLSKLNAGALMGRSLLLGRRHRVRFDARFVNLMAAMTVLQGVALQLYSDGDILGRMTPYVLGAAMSGLTGARWAKTAPDEENKVSPALSTGVAL